MMSNRRVNGAELQPKHLPEHRPPMLDTGVLRQPGVPATTTPSTLPVPSVHMALPKKPNCLFAQVSGYLVQLGRVR